MSLPNCLLPSESAHNAQPTIMFTLAYGSGARDYSVEGPAWTKEQWASMRHAAARLLRARGAEAAADLIERLPFEVHEGTNFFGDEFLVLLAEVEVDEYARLVEEYSDRASQEPFRRISKALNEICPGYIRFVAVRARIDGGPTPVPDPEPSVSSRIVTEALNEARFLVDGRGSLSGIDRAHTAFHGFLRALCETAELDVPADADVTALFKALRKGHPKLKADGPRADDITRVLHGLATVVNSLNPLRNLASMAHPNEELLGVAEANLMLNAIRTLMHYLDERVGPDA